MILLLHPRTTRPKNRRFPLSVLALGAVLEGREDFEIVDGNVDADPLASLSLIMSERPAELLGVSVMPGPQMVAAIELSKGFRARYPKVPIVWGGYFPSLYPDAALNAPYVDALVRAQGEDTILELLNALRAEGSLRSQQLAKIDGISYRDDFGLPVHTRDRAVRSPGGCWRVKTQPLAASRAARWDSMWGRWLALNQSTISEPRATQTPWCDKTYSKAARTARMRCGWPTQ